MTRGRSLSVVAAVYPDVIEEEVVSAAERLPELAQIAILLCTLLPELGKEMEANAAARLETLLLAAITAVQGTTFGDKNPKLAALGVAVLR